MLYGPLHVDLKVKKKDVVLHFMCSLCGNNAGYFSIFFFNVLLLCFCRSCWRKIFKICTFFGFGCPIYKVSL